jgi:predicted transcriptional regulator
MIVRILNEGQWRLSDEAVRGLNTFDDAVEQAVAARDQDQLTRALHMLLDRIRTTGTRVPDEALEDSDLILPDADSTLDEVQQLLSESEEGLIPGVSAP